MNKSNKKRILICGGTGFMGQRLVKELLRQRKNINLFVHGEIPQSFQNKDLNIFKGDILDKKTLKPALEKSDIVVNLVGAFFKDIYLLNIVSSFNLLEACKESNIKKVIFISSEAVYGKYPGRPCLESDRPEPTTEYGLSKYLAEQLYEFYSDKYNIPVIVLRPSNTYGPGQKQGVVFECLSSIFKNQPVVIHSDGKQRRAFVYVDDVVSGIIKSIDYKSKGFDIFNISGTKAYSLLEFISVLRQNFKREIQVKFLTSKKPYVRDMCSSYQKAKTLLGYEPKINLEKGIKKTIKCTLDYEILRKTKF